MKFKVQSSKLESWNLNFELSNHSLDVVKSQPETEVTNIRYLL